MNKKTSDELLKEFWISQGENVYTIKATSRAYQLLGLSDHVRMAKNIHPHEMVLYDTIDKKYYLYAFLSFLSYQYQIDGLYRVSSGNAHDANYVNELTIIHGGGIWKNDFHINTMRRDWTEYVVRKESSVTDEVLMHWSEEFNLTGDGEDERFVFCSDKSHKLMFKFCFRHLLGPANVPAYYYKATDKDAVISNVCLKELDEEEMKSYCEYYLKK